MLLIKIWWKSSAAWIVVLATAKRVFVTKRVEFIACMTPCSQNSSEPVSRSTPPLQQPLLPTSRQATRDGAGIRRAQPTRSEPYPDRGEAEAVPTSIFDLLTGRGIPIWSSGTIATLRCHALISSLTRGPCYRTNA